MSLIKYETETPPSLAGVYACRNLESNGILYEDLFLLWMSGNWYYLGSDQKFRGKLAGWIGPLQRKMQ